MLNIERVDDILKELRLKKAVLVSQLSRQYGVSPSTIRRDFAELEKEGLLRRTYGGAMLIEHQTSEIPYTIRTFENKAEKNIIGKLAAKLVRDDMHISLDCTSTVAHMVRFLGKKNNLKILTNSAQLALDCLDNIPGAQICCTGGWLNNFARGFTGEAARQRVADFTCDVLFFSARSISMESGVTDVNEEDVCIKKQMLKSARKAVFLCDSSKFDRTSFRWFCGIDEIDCLVTNEKPSEKWLEVLSKANVKVIYPKENERDNSAFPALG